MSKWNWAWQPWLPQASSVATAPNPRFCQPSLESGTPRLCCRAEVGRCTSAWGLQTPTSRGRMQGGGVLHLCGSYGLAACISQYDCRWTSRHSEPFGQNSLKMACLSYSHSGFFNPASLFLGKFLRIIIPGCSGIESGLGCQSHKTTESFGIFWSVS